MSATDETCTSHRSAQCRSGNHGHCNGDARCPKLGLTVDCLCACHEGGDR